MKNFIGPALFAIATAAVSHLAIVHYAPNFIMDRAMTMLAARTAEFQGSSGGDALHQFRLSPRMTPQSQTVVRPSPDLAYSACLFDLSQAPAGIEVKMAASEGYSSLSFFDAATNNFSTIRGNGGDVEVTLLPPGTQANGAGALESPSNRGIILIRRLAPSLAEYEAVAQIAPADACGPAPAG